MYRGIMTIEAGFKFVDENTLYNLSIIRVTSSKVFFFNFLPSLTIIFNTKVSFTARSLGKSRLHFLLEISL